MKNLLNLVFVLVYFTGTASLAADNKLDIRSHTINPNDFFSVSGISASQLSPSGTKVVWSEVRWEQQLGRTNRNLWIIDVKTRNKKRITASPESDNAPNWSPDEKFVYFSRKVVKEKSDNQEKLKQVFRYSFDSGQVRQVTNAAKGVKQFQLSHDGMSLYYTTTKEHKDSGIWAGMREKHSSPDYGHGAQMVNPLLRLDLNQWRTSNIIDDNKVVWDFEVSNDGSKLARITTTDNELIHLEGWSDVEVYQIDQQINLVLEDRLWRSQAPSPYGWLEGVSWSDDSKALAFRVDFDGYPGELFIFEFSKGKVTNSRKLDRIQDITLTGSDIAWRPKSRTLCYRAADHARVQVICTDKLVKGRQGKTYRALGKELVAYNFSFDNKGKKIAFTHNGTDHFSDIFISKVNSSASRFTRLTDINPQTSHWQLPSVEIVKWKAKDGTEIEGILELPPGYKKSDGPLPTIIQIHGGPTSATPYALRFRHYGQTSFAAQGWAVMSPNYRGSTGYGDKFLTDLVGRENDIEVDDILAGVDFLVESGIADDEKMAVMGWSNGGYLTNALITKTNRFKAASSGAGNLDQKLQWIIEDTPGHVVNFMQGQPWEQLEGYNHSSPLSYMQNVTTPTLIHMGENDPRVPVAHARGLYRALKHYLNVPVELIVYPGEGHGLSQYQHREAKMDWDIKWFNYYVLGKLPKTN